MKIISDNVAYVQLNDIIGLNPLDLEVPVSILSAIFREKLKEEENPQNIFLEFEDKEALKYLKKAKWIIDYNRYKDYSIQEIDALIDKISYRYSTLANFFNSHEINNEKINNYICNKFFIMEKEVDGLNDLILYKKGIYELVLPENIEKKNKNKVLSK